jgi:hypothetical protein
VNARPPGMAGSPRSLHPSGVRDATLGRVAEELFVVESGGAEDSVRRRMAAGSTGNGGCAPGGAEGVL